ncbi:MAG: NADH-quinone oxidoreductase subunit C [Elusimicrobia bacterium]|nr:NADH-quinone oxidoreductase subunit C [Elusimicrobiota bacterium]
MEFESRWVGPGRAFDVLKYLKEEGYNVLADLFGVDYSKLGREPRFEVVYRLACLNPDTGLEDKPRVEVHCATAEEPELRSVASLWPAADWLEREVWDMFGIRFVDRPEIKRILLYEAFSGHPLRKDYPIAKRQPLIGPPAGEAENNPSFNSQRPALKYE